jgi:hypothetical protein
MRGMCRLRTVVATIGASGPACWPATASEMHSEMAERDSLPRVKPKCPIPAEPNQIFYVQRLPNANVVVDDANLDPSGKLDADGPVKVDWRRYNNNGRAKPLDLARRISG